MCIRDSSGGETGEAGTAPIPEPVPRPTGRAGATGPTPSNEWAPLLRAEPQSWMTAVKSFNDINIDLYVFATQLYRNITYACFGRD